jgi:hypothetical protein
MREEEPREVGAGSYFVVAARDFSTFVSTEMARHIESCLDAWPRRPWITFVDVSGSRVRIRAAHIRWICQSTPEQRQRDRDLARALHEERKADRWPEE